jgi:hypothetical protein
MFPTYTTAPSTADIREWWRAESARVGTDWVTLLDAAEQVLSKLRVLHVGLSSS